MTTPSEKKSSSSVEKKAKPLLPAQEGARDMVSIDEFLEALPKDDSFDVLVPLVDAARYAGEDPQELVQAAAREEIELVFECPPGPLVVLEADEPRVEGKEFAAADFLRTPEYFVVRPSYCVGWKHRSAVEISEAAIGYRKAHGGMMLQPLLAQKAHEHRYPLRFLGQAHPVPHEGYDVDVESIHWLRWILWVNGFPYRYPVKIEDLLVRQKAFRSWMGWDQAHKPTTAYLPEQYKPKKADLDGHEFLSPQLLRMCEAASKIWGREGVIRDDPRTYPGDDVVIDFLMDSGTRFSRSAAEAAARLIRPPFAASKPGPTPK